MKNKRKLLRRSLLALAAAGLLALVVAYSLKGAFRMQPFTSPTQSFIETHMKNANGTIATYLREAKPQEADIVAGREALSESLGFWMVYAAQRGDRPRFEQAVSALKRFFLAPENYLYWKLDEDGTASVTTEALGDDLRVIGALLEAADRWEEPEYSRLAASLSETLNRSVRSGEYFVDFHDFANGRSASVFSLAYDDIGALRRMNAAGLIDGDMLERHAALLRDMPVDGVFYPKSYAVSTGGFVYDDTVNLIDQLLVGLHGAEAGRKPSELTEFLRREFAQRGRLPGRYDRESRKPAADYESPSVYGLAILLALEEGDREWAAALAKRMLALRGEDGAYSGGYVFDGDTHVFDNLLPLLAEDRLHDR
ncbi:glycosyl hydrolase [Saccharibacillus sp. CPCC 101409]|uniref:glycosyl hydrolase n=1 Tax=Saccharibacillus sp. CPCC 101409 TaxID=3058041 RepID=UPI002673895D|nr:glycosyl hydrolase [Saccharibacillus sp. CPCC 101409]MDO3409945.1 glycosyl hydrolase [Saccharibacillus sp. CPCC 101409]